MNVYIDLNADTREYVKISLTALQRTVVSVESATLIVLNSKEKYAAGEPLLRMSVTAAPKNRSAHLKKDFTELLLRIRNTELYFQNQEKDLILPKMNLMLLTILHRMVLTEGYLFTISFTQIKIL